MRFRYRSTPFIACALLLVAGTAFAQKPTATPVPLDISSVSKIQIGTPLSGNTACILGNQNPPA